MFFFVEAPETCLRELHRVLRPGGRLVVVTATPPDDPTTSSPWLPALRTYTDESMERMLRDAGFSRASVSHPISRRQVASAT